MHLGAGRNAVRAGGDGDLGDGGRRRDVDAGRRVERIHVVVEIFFPTPTEDAK